jgi:hypothetical protein
MAADFNMPFWIAIATAAPVIGLATAVTADQAVKSYERATERALSANEEPPRFRWLDLGVAYFNVIVQSVVLWAALASLSISKDASPRQLVIAIEVISLLIVFLPSYVGAGRAIAARRQKRL